MILLISMIAIGPLLGILLWLVLGPSESQQHAQQDAQVACLAEPEGLTDYPPTNSVTFGNMVDAYRSSETAAKAAAADDPSWRPLASGYATLLSAWTARVLITGPGATEPEKLPVQVQARLDPLNARWEQPEHLAVITIERQCANDGVATLSRAGD